MYSFGASPLVDALAVARRTLQPAADGVPRFLLLAVSGEANCDAALDGAQCVCPDPDQTHCIRDPRLRRDDARPPAAVAALHAEGVVTFVVSPVDLSGVGGPAAVLALDALAVAGGAARHGAAHPWYGARDVTALRDDVAVAVGSAARCHVRAVRALPGGVALTLRAASSGVVPRDAAHENGWDWTDAARGELTVYGAACESLARRGDALTLVSDDARCTSAAAHAERVRRLPVYVLRAAHRRVAHQPAPRFDALSTFEARDSPPA